jgi:hypothetical protein
MCRKHHGAPFATFTLVPQEALRWVSGEHDLLTYESSPGRLRKVCGTCGAVAPVPLGQQMLVPLANLVGDVHVREGLHVFTASKAPWHVIADELPQFPEGPPGAPAAVHRSARPLSPGGTDGSCLCGQVAFRVHDAPGRWMQCHCSRCRRGRSAAHGSNGFYAAEQFEWLTGKDLVRRYKVPEAERFMVCFCAECGGGTPVERENVPFVLVPMGLLDQDPGFTPQAHIHVASKAPWYTLRDGLPQFAELPA